MEACVVSERGRSPDACRNAQTAQGEKGAQTGVEEHQLLLLELETSAHSNHYSHTRYKTS